MSFADLYGEDVEADDEITATRSAIAEAADLIKRIRAESAARPSPFDQPDEPDDGGGRHRVRHRAVRTVRNGGRAPSRSSGISGAGIG